MSKNLKEHSPLGGGRRLKFDSINIHSEDKFLPASICADRFVWFFPPLGARTGENQWHNKTNRKAKYIFLSDFPRICIILFEVEKNEERKKWGPSLTQKRNIVCIK